MKRYYVILLIFIFQGYGKTDKSNSKIEDNFEQEWRSPETSEFLPIGKVIVKNRIRGCGEYRVKMNLHNSNEYLVACTSDGEIWNNYLTKLNEGSVFILNENISNPD